MSHITFLFWYSNYDLKLIFFNYPNLTLYQEAIIPILHQKILEHKNKITKGNLFVIEQ
ncbi:hypothetical protein [Methanosphaera sp.]|uniref:hypothetical protein n=1 Tax=Methanosphaera sp. TaxID=2666342 RepID=UPI0025DC221F|nr:hypothetical protein [Methanosphaera sp.]